MYHMWFYKGNWPLLLNEVLSMCANHLDVGKVVSHFLSHLKRLHSITLSLIPITLSPQLWHTVLPYKEQKWVWDCCKCYRIQYILLHAQWYSIQWAFWIQLSAHDTLTMLQIYCNVRPKFTILHEIYFHIRHTASKPTNTFSQRIYQDAIHILKATIFNFERDSFQKEP